MNTAEVIEGTVHPDGTLELAGKLTLPPGQVRITVESLVLPPVPPGHFEALFEEIDRLLKAGGYRGRTVEEMKADEAAEDAEDEEYEERWREIHRQTSGSDSQEIGG